MFFIPGNRPVNDPRHVLGIRLDTESTLAMRSPAIMFNYRVGHCMAHQRGYLDCWHAAFFCIRRELVSG